MTICAIYRVYYGSDWLKYAIRSVIDQVDNVVVFYNDKPWCRPTHVEWRGEKLPVPPYSPDGADKVLASMHHPKLHIINDNHPDQAGQSSHHVEVVKEMFHPDVVMIASCDHVESEDVVKTVVGSGMHNRVVSTRPVTVWRWPHLRLPQRMDRPCTTFWDLAAWGGSVPFSELWQVREHGLVYHHHTFDMHFASHPNTMWWRCMLRDAQAQHLPDDSVREGWYENVWAKWQRGSEVSELGWCKGEPQLGQPYELDVRPPMVLRHVIEESREWFERGL